MSPRIAKIRDAIQETEKCQAAHFASAPIREMFGNKVAWEGVVECFDLKGHPKAKRAYGWTYKDDQEDQFVIVLEIPPVDSAQTAVRVAIASAAK
ncbi:MAG TPA: hypothetical protein VGG34_04885 [Opitutaceae bacterium]